METQAVKEKIAQMKSKYLDEATADQERKSSFSDEKKASAIKKKLVHLESLRCQKMRSGEDLAEVEAKISKLKTDFKSL